jgi:hypothetical protein
MLSMAASSQAWVTAYVFTAGIVLAGVVLDMRWLCNACFLGTLATVVMHVVRATLRRQLPPVRVILGCNVVVLAATSIVRDHLTQQEAAAIVAAGIARVIVASRDPFPAVNGGGIDELRRSGIGVRTGVCEREARRLIAPFSMLVEQQRPWMIAKWAMSLDGRVATAAGMSRWISSEPSRAIVHELRGRMDGILCGIGTVLADLVLADLVLGDLVAAAGGHLGQCRGGTGDRGLNSHGVARSHRCPELGFGLGDQVRSVGLFHLHFRRKLG